jgi:putative phosphoesterase
VRIGVFADSHDHIGNIRLVVEEFNRRKCDLVLFAGDLVSPIAIPPLRKLDCPMISCFGDNEGNRPGVKAGMKIIGPIDEGPIPITTEDGTKIVMTHIWKEVPKTECDAIIYAHTHKPKIHTSESGILCVNPGELAGWVFGDATYVIMETKPLSAELFSL